MLINNNIFYTESFLINFANTFAHILSSEGNIAINARHYSKFWKRKVLANIATFILPKSEALILF